MVKFYKFCYALGVRLHIRKLELWAYSRWFKNKATKDIMAYFTFAEDFFKFCKKWGLKAKVGK